MILDLRIEFYDRIFFVINQKDNHWFLCEIRIRNKTRQEMIIYDSMRKNDENRYYKFVKTKIDQIFEINAELLVDTECS